jgi:hypothetical protein
MRLLILLTGSRSLSETPSESSPLSRPANARQRSVMAAVGQTGLDTEGFGLADKVWHRARLHLAHHLSAVNLDRDFAAVKRRELRNVKAGNSVVRRLTRHVNAHSFK